MDEHVDKVKQVLTNWNPLGNKASQIKDLDDYETEAYDILFYINKKSSTDYINKIMVDVLSQAFEVDLELENTRKYAKEIRAVIKYDS